MKNFGVRNDEVRKIMDAANHVHINFKFLGDFYKLLFKRFMNLYLRRFLYFLKEHSRLLTSSLYF